MKVTPDDIVADLATVVDLNFARTLVDAYIQMQQRFLAGDWQPAELDGGRLCEAAARCLLQLDMGMVNTTLLPGKISEMLLDKKQQYSHVLHIKDRDHVFRAITLVYKFRSDRGAVHISPIHDANFMDSMLVVHASKWILAEVLRLSLKKDLRSVGEVIAQLVQLEHSMIHELDGIPLVLAKGVSASEEILLLLNHAPSNRLARADILAQAKNQTRSALSQAITRLIVSKEIRVADNEDLALTPNGQRRVMETIIPKYSPG